LTVINYLNSAASFFASHMPSGEGESSSTTGGMPQATTSDGVTPLDPVQTPATGGTSTSQTSQAAVLLTTTSPPATSGGSTIDPAAGSTVSADGQSSSTPVDSSAADDLFAELAAAREQLHRRFSRR